MKKTISAFLALLMIAGTVLIAPKASAVDVSYDQIVDAAANIIRRNEGDYKSVHADDNGALSVGWIQWHGNRALNLLKNIINAHPASALYVLGNTFYNEIVTATDWSKRVATKDEAAKLSILLDTIEGHAEQDKLAKKDISAYIDHGMRLGITSPTALIYFADLENQCGGGGSARIAKSAMTAAGSYEAVTLEAIHQAALSDSVSGKKEFVPRRNNTYERCVMLGWSNISGKYEVWTATADLRIRSGPGTNYSILSMLYNGSNTLITDKKVVGNDLWGKNQTGWLCLEYCTYSSGSVPTPVVFDTSGASFSPSRVTLTATGINTYRGDSALIIYNSEFGSDSTNTNIYGAEAVVGSDGKVLTTPVRGNSNSTIPAGGFVVSGHDGATAANGYAVSGNIKAGDYVYFDKATMTVSVFNNKNDYLIATKKISDGSSIGELPVVSKPGVAFDGWYTAPSGGEKVTSASSFSTHTVLTLYARWGAEAPVTFNTNGGVIENTATKAVTAINTTRGEDQLILYNNSFKKPSTDTNMYGAEAAVDADGKVLNTPAIGIKDTVIPDGGFVLSGHDKAGFWLVNNISIGNYVRFNDTAKTITVYKDKETYEAAYKQLSANSALGTLPGAARDGCYEFIGWADPAGNIVNEDTVVPYGGIVLSAQWKQHPRVTETVSHPTCTGSGKKTVVCSICGAVLSDEVIPATDHAWIAVNTVIATCVDRGYTEYICENDITHTKLDDIVPPTGIHTPDAPEITAPACTENGLRVTKCSVCSEIISEEIISATDHSWVVSRTVEATCVDEGYTEYICENDHTHTKRDDIVPAAVDAHAPGSAEVEAEATCTSDGLLVTRCTVCGKTVSTEILPALGHNWVREGAASPDKDADGYILYICSHDEEHIMKFTYTVENLVYGDVNNDGRKGCDDVIYMLAYLKDHENFPVNLNTQKSCDYNRDGKTDRNDAIYLLYSIMMPERYPL